MSLRAYFWLGVAVGFVAIVWILVVALGDDGMSTCLRSHTYDVCHSSLYR